MKQFVLRAASALPLAACAANIVDSQFDAQKQRLLSGKQVLACVAR
jgi:hypothetical protein